MSEAPIMSFRLITPIVALAAIVAMPATAQAKSDCSRALLKSANHHRSIVVSRHGNRAAGRDIVRYGVIRANQHASPARCSEIRRYRNQLIVLHTEPKLRPLIVRTAVKPYRPPAGVQTPSVAAPAGGTLSAIRQCESGGNYATNTGNGFYGAYQFTQSTWESVGGSGNPAAASQAEQDRRAAMLYAREGASPWPVCGR
jgi:hypothetical protein